MICGKLSRPTHLKKIYFFFQKDGVQVLFVFHLTTVFLADKQFSLAGKPLAVHITKYQDDGHYVEKTAVRPEYNR